MEKDKKYNVVLGLMIFFFILFVGISLAWGLSSIGKKTTENKVDKQDNQIVSENDEKKDKAAAEKEAEEKAAAEKAAAEKAAAEKAAAEKAAAEKAAAEKAAAEKAAAEKAAAGKAAAEKAAAEKAAAQKAAAEKAAAEKERLENLPAVLVNDWHDYDIEHDRIDMNFTFEQTQNVKYIDVYLLNFAGNEISAENYNGVSSNKFRIIPTGVNAQLSVYNTSDSIESVKLVVTYNNGKTDIYYSSFGLG